ncbi:MAG: PDZ domain-containing protein [Bacteroidetes bacterium]|nr:PDZ domain-containing protein [Bacteroidota bacterium]
MRRIRISTAVLAVIMALVTPAALFAQEKEKTEKGEKGEKGEKEKKEVQQIVITRKGDKEGKTVVEINGDKVLINGKPLEEYKDKNGDLSVRMNKLRDIESLTYLRGGQPMAGFNFNNGDYNMFYSVDENKAMLGVTTEKTEEGALVQEVTKESAAEKIGLKPDDIITKIDDKKIEGPDDLSEAIKAHKPGDKVAVTYLRDKKEQKAQAELTKWKGISLFGSNPVKDFKLNFDGIDPKNFPDMKQFRGISPNGGGQNWNWSGGGSPKLGLSVQDTDDGKGVKVIEVDEESNAAKAGIKEEDIITHIDDKAVNGVDEITKLLREKKENPVVRFQVSRAGKSQNIEVKMPRKIKTADL